MYIKILFRIINSTFVKINNFLMKIIFSKMVITYKCNLALYAGDDRKAIYFVYNNQSYRAVSMRTCYFIYNGSGFAMTKLGTQKIIENLFATVDIKHDHDQTKMDYDQYGHMCNMQYINRNKNLDIIESIIDNI